ncbi:MAG: nucleotidyltransferase domain-containing protein [Candidatus Helarchaeota archaeon]
MNITNSNSELYTTQILKAIKKELLRYNPMFIILHGSLLKKDKITQNSDIDLILISDIFKNINFFTRMKYVQNLLRKFTPLKIDVICLTYQEFINSLHKRKELFYSLQKGYKILYKNNQLTIELDKNVIFK